MKECKFPAEATLSEAYRQAHWQAFEAYDDVYFMYDNARHEVYYGTARVRIHGMMLDTLEELKGLETDFWLKSGKLRQRITYETGVLLKRAGAAHRDFPN